MFPYERLSPVHSGKFSLTSCFRQGKLTRVYGATEFSLVKSHLLESWRASFPTSLTSANLVCVHTDESRRQALRGKNCRRKLARVYGALYWKNLWSARWRFPYARGWHVFLLELSLSASKREHSLGVMGLRTAILQHKK